MPVYKIIDPKFIESLKGGWIFSTPRGRVRAQVKAQQTQAKKHKIREEALKLPDLFKEEE